MFGEVQYFNFFDYKPVLIDLIQSSLDLKKTKG